MLSLGSLLSLLGYHTVAGELTQLQRTIRKKSHGNSFPWPCGYSYSSIYLM